MEVRSGTFGLRDMGADMGRYMDVRMDRWQTDSGAIVSFVERLHNAISLHMGRHMDVQMAD